MTIMSKPKPAGAARNKPTTTTRISQIIKKTRHQFVYQQNTQQRQMSKWMLVAILQSLFWLFGLPIICRKYIWDDIFNSAIIQRNSNTSNSNSNSNSVVNGIAIADFLLSFSTPVLFFISYNLIMIPIYIGRYSFFEQYKIQKHLAWPWFDERKNIRDGFWKLTFKSIKLSSINLLVLLPILTCLKIVLQKKLSAPNANEFLFSTDDEHWPTPYENCRDIITLSLIHELGFYFAHKMSHLYPTLYNYHKVHHEYKTNWTMASQHNHPIDFILSIGGPALLALVIVSKAHSMSQFQFILWTMYSNLDDHVGYSFPWSPVRWFPFSAMTNEHEFHHSKNLGCFGSKLSIYNTLFGGYERYNKYQHDQKQKEF
jgi:sterol desaturase/sphingolipid hydroxylase (fatty acid hydroxylase superfamily)